MKSLLFIVFIISSCTNAHITKEIEEPLRAAGDNKEELQRVVEYFSLKPQDSLKLKAAVFLIKNMPGLYYYEGKKLDQYLNYVTLINRGREQANYIKQSFINLYGPFNKSDLALRYDLEHIKAKDIITNINIAFKVWEEQPWGKNITFDQFCEYILPFRISDETPENNREKIYKQFNPLLDSVRSVGGNALDACIIINNKLQKDGWLFTPAAEFLPHLSTSNLIEHRTGSCRDMTDAAVYIMRAVGIPVGIDIVQQWPYKSLGHMWNTLLDEKGNNVMFMGIDQNPWIPHKPGTKKGKVYRRTYSIVSQSLAMQKKPHETVPVFFMNPRIKDVTDEYVKPFNVRIALDKTSRNNKHAYLCVFNNADWIPIHWAKVHLGNATFAKMEGNIVYLPAYYDKHQAIPANYPFVLNDQGKIKLLKPDSIQLNSEMILTRVFPIIPDQFVSNNLIGSRLQAGNKPDFSDAEDLDIIKNPMPFWNIVNVKTRKKYRYARILSPTGMRCGIAELHFYSSKAKLRGRLIGTKESYNENLQSIGNSMDNDLSTCFVSKFSTGSWVGVDFGKPEMIEKIKYSAPINEKKDKIIISGDKYELFYWGKGKWISKGSRVATDSKVVFTKIPSNALYMIRNISRQMDQRIFTYENGKQIWW